MYADRVYKRASEPDPQVSAGDPGETSEPDQRKRALHAPAPRAQVVEESRSVVVADDAAEDTPTPARARPRELGAYGRKLEPTLVLDRNRPSLVKKDAQQRTEANGLGHLMGSPTWRLVAMLVAGCVAAFAFGTLVALWLQARRTQIHAGSAQTSLPQVPSARATTTPPGPKPVPLTDLPLDTPKSRRRP